MTDIDLWGKDIFLIDELAQRRPLTAVAFTFFKVTRFKHISRPPESDQSVSDKQGLQAGAHVQRQQRA